MTTYTWHGEGRKLPLSRPKYGDKYATGHMSDAESFELFRGSELPMQKFPKETKF